MRKTQLANYEKEPKLSQRGAKEEAARVAPLRYVGKETHRHTRVYLADIPKALSHAIQVLSRQHPLAAFDTRAFLALVFYVLIGGSGKVLEAVEVWTLLAHPTGQRGREPS
jgi:hypothetical protein